MKFDLNQILSLIKGKKKRKTQAEDFQKDPETEFDEIKDIFDEEENVEENVEEGVTDKKNKKKNDKKSKLPIDFKNKKVQLSIAAVVVLASAAMLAPYVMSYIGTQEANKIANISDITPTPAPKVNRVNNNYNYKPNHNYYKPNNSYKYKPNHNYKPNHVTSYTKVHKNNLVKKVNHKNTMKEKQITITSQKTEIAQTQTNKINPKKIEEALKNTNKKIKEIQQHLLNSKLEGKNDPIGMVDESIIKNRNFNLYLQSQIQLMKKLIDYYKQKAELQKTLQLYKMAFYGQQQDNTRKQNINNNRVQETKRLQKILKEVVAPLQQQISSLKQQLRKQKEQNNKNIQKMQSYSNFNQAVKMNLNNLNIFVKNGKYIAVIHTEMGDRIFKEGDYFNGYKIDKILPNMIIFEKDGQKFYYTYNQTLNQKYEVAQIALPKKITKSEVRNSNNKKTGVKEYKNVSRKELLQQLLQKRIQKMQ